MTVSQLRKKLKGVDGKLPVYIADHDHGEYETNSIVNNAYVIDQSKADDWHRNQLERNPEFKIEGKYFVIRP